MTHPSKTDLALLPGSDLSFFKKLWVERHVTSCAECRDEVARFRTERATVRAAAAGLPAGLDWDRLAGEMRANIRVGFEAGQCVDLPRPVFRGRPGWIWASGAAAAAVFVAGALWVRPIGPARKPTAVSVVTTAVPPPGSVVLKATASGVEWERDGRAMTLTYAGNAVSTVSVAAGVVNARYVDDVTGQVTIHHVYSE